MIISENANMKEGIVLKGPTVKLIDMDIPKPQPKQVVIKVVVSGSNPKDWYVIVHDIIAFLLIFCRKLPDMMGVELNQGDDIAGVVHEVGQDVYDFKVGDRGRWCAREATSSIG